jgi:cAMP-dependent protein kinase regulator
MYGDKRSASIKAQSDCILWELDGRTFKSIVMSGVVQRRNKEFGYLDNVPLMSKLDRYEKFKLLDGLEAMYFAKGQKIITEGDEGDYFYIIEEGKVECFKNEGGNDLVVRSLDKGEHFGEIALIKNENRSLSVRATSDKVKVLALNRLSFNRILGSIEKYLKKDY